MKVFIWGHPQASSGWHLHPDLGLWHQWCKETSHRASVWEWLWLSFPRRLLYSKPFWDDCLFFLPPPSAQDPTFPSKGIPRDEISSWKWDSVPLPELETKHASLHLMSSFDIRILGYMFMLLDMCVCHHGRGEENFHRCKVWCSLLPRSHC